MNLQKNKKFRLQSSACSFHSPVGIMKSMDKNTAIDGDEEPPTLIRVRACGELPRQTAADARRLAQAGVKTLVFPDEGTLREWRERLAALA